MEADQFSYEVTLDAAEEIDQAISYYDLQFSSGAADFLTAFDDTILRILKMPEARKRRSSEDPDTRGQQLVAKKESSSYATKFPYLLIYKVYLAEKNSDLPTMAF